ncbi:MAG: hypothetical protein LH702_30575 [Phormidesmis sp. CAN_BIN44]|nr:hypothetical protein [Phormidesmis sp. CAN_BIN44]
MLSEWHVRRVLVMHLGEINQMPLLSPALEHLKRVLPEAVITFLCAPDASETALCLPGVDEILMHRSLTNTSNTLSCDPVSASKLIQILKSEQFDAAILLSHGHSSPYPMGYLCYLAEIPIRVGVSQEFGGGVLLHWVNQIESETTDRNLWLLESVGLVNSMSIALKNFDSSRR